MEESCPLKNLYLYRVHDVILLLFLLLLPFLVLMVLVLVSVLYIRYGVSTVLVSVISIGISIIAFVTPLRKLIEMLT